MKLRVKARGSAMQPDFDAMREGHRRFVGRSLDRNYGEDKRWAYVPTNEVHDIPAYAEYVRAIKEGDLWAADQETADYCGVKFDSRFGALEKSE